MEKGGRGWRRREVGEGKYGRRRCVWREEEERRGGGRELTLHKHVHHYQ